MSIILDIKNGLGSATNFKLLTRLGALLFAPLRYRILNNKKIVRFYKKPLAESGKICFNTLYHIYGIIT